MKHSPSNHPRLFRVVTTVVFSLLLFNTVAVNYTQDDPLSQLLSTLENIFFGTTSTATTSLSSSSTSSDSTLTGIDPSGDPPPPPPK